MIRKPDGMACEEEKLLLTWMHDRIHDWMQQICMSEELSTKFGKSIIIVFPMFEEQTLRDIKGICCQGKTKDILVTPGKELCRTSAFWRRETVRISGVATRTDCSRRVRNP